MLGWIPSWLHSLNPAQDTIQSVTGLADPGTLERTDVDPHWLPLIGAGLYN